MIVLFILVVGAVVAFVKTGAEETGSFGGSCSSGNATACAEEQAEEGDTENPSFWDYVGNADPTELEDDAPPILNGLWLLVVTFLIGLAILLIATAFVFGLSS